MACPLWGDGSKWGDGDLWCRVFNTQPYVTDPVDYTVHWLGVAINYADTGIFVIDRISPNIDWGRSQQDFTYSAFCDLDNVSRLGVQVSYSENASFTINFITPQIRVKKHVPVG